MSKEPAEILKILDEAQQLLNLMNEWRDLDEPFNLRDLLWDAITDILELVDLCDDVGKISGRVNTYAWDYYGKEAK